MQGYGFDPIFLGKVSSELSEQQLTVTSPFTQRRNVNRHRIQPVIKVFTELPLFATVQQINIGGSHYPDIGFLDFGTTDFYEFTILEHPQQPGLGAKGHFANLIQKNGTPIGYFEITLTGFVCTGKGAFFMTK